MEVDLTLTGDGTSMNPLNIARRGANEGDVLKWDGFEWRPGEDENTDHQTLSLIDNELFISNGNMVLLPGHEGEQRTEP